MTAATPMAFFDDPHMLAPRRVVREDLEGGEFILRSPERLQPYERCVGEWLEHWARETPTALAVAEPAAGGGWTEMTWKALRQRVGAVATCWPNASRSRNSHGYSLKTTGTATFALPETNSLPFHPNSEMGNESVAKPACAAAASCCRYAIISAAAARGAFRSAERRQCPSDGARHWLKR